MIKGITQTLYPGRWANGGRSYRMNETEICWLIDGYWVDGQTFEEAKLLFDRWKRLRVFD